MEWLMHFMDYYFLAVNKDSSCSAFNEGLGWFLLCVLGHCPSVLWSAFQSIWLRSSGSEQILCLSAPQDSSACFCLSVSSISPSDPVPLAATLPPPGFTDDAGCLRSWAAPHFLFLSISLLEVGLGFTNPKKALPGLWWLFYLDVFSLFFS